MQRDFGMSDFSIGLHNLQLVGPIAKGNAFTLKGSFTLSVCVKGLVHRKSFTRSCLWRFRVKLQHSIRAVSGEPLSSSRFEEVL